MRDRREAERAILLALSIVSALGAIACGDSDNSVTAPEAPYFISGTLVDPGFYVRRPELGRFVVATAVGSDRPTVRLFLNKPGPFKIPVQPGDYLVSNIVRGKAYYWTGDRMTLDPSLAVPVTMSESGEAQDLLFEYGSAEIQFDFEPRDIAARDLRTSLFLATDGEPRRIGFVEAGHRSHIYSLPSGSYTVYLETSVGEVVPVSFIREGRTEDELLSSVDHPRHKAITSDPTFLNLGLEADRSVSFDAVIVDTNGVVLFRGEGPSYTQASFPVWKAVAFKVRLELRDERNVWVGGDSFESARTFVGGAGEVIEVPVVIARP